MRRCACGYFDELHDAAGKCPLCPCGEVPAAHVPEDDGKLRCPGKETRLRRGSFREVAPRRYETRPGWGDVLFPAPDEVEVEPVIGPPLVPARPCRIVDEVARQALRLGAKAAAAGWDVSPHYAVTHDGVELSALWMRHGDGRRALALWARPSGAAWATRGAMISIIGVSRRKHVGVKFLESSFL